LLARVDRYAKKTKQSRATIIAKALELMLAGAASPTRRQGQR
jgi:predicted transcriptional regulator